MGPASRAIKTQVSPVVVWAWSYRTGNVKYREGYTHKIQRYSNGLRISRIWIETARPANDPMVLRNLRW